MFNIYVGYRRNMAITNIRQQVVQDFRDKVILEPKLGRKLRVLDKQIVTQFRQDMLKGELTRAEIFQPELEEILASHYEVVADKFEGRIADDASDDVALTIDEQANLTAAIGAFIVARAATQSKIISNNTQKDMGVAAQVVIGETPDQIERSVAASALLSRRLRVREGAIASLETQAMAEAVKLAEFDVFAKKDPLSLQPPSEQMFKEWVTVGDERVRAAHAAADAQVRRVEELFKVGGQQLRFPGDTSFGATAGNVINCRCSAVYDIAAVFAIRRRAGVAPITEIVPSEALVTSLGG